MAQNHAQMRMQSDLHVPAKNLRKTVLTQPKRRLISTLRVPLLAGSSTGILNTAPVARANTHCWAEPHTQGEWHWPSQNKLASVHISTYITNCVKCDSDGGAGGPFELICFNTLASAADAGKKLTVPGNHAAEHFICLVQCRWNQEIAPLWVTPYIRTMGTAWSPCCDGAANRLSGFPAQ